MESLVFVESPEITIATNKFIHVPIILQYEDLPLIQIVKIEQAGFSIEIPIYHPDGTYLAKAVGSRLFTTPAGKKAGLKLSYRKNMTICELEDKTLFEIHRTAAAAMRARAELYTPDGAFIKCHPDLDPQLFLSGIEQPLNIGGVTFSGNTFQNLKIGILIKKDGSLAIGVG